MMNPPGRKMGCVLAALIATLLFFATAGGSCSILCPPDQVLSDGMCIDRPDGS